jgi:hypothetical protein
MPAPLASGGSESPGGPCTHWKSAALSRPECQFLSTLFQLFTTTRPNFGQYGPALVLRRRTFGERASILGVSRKIASTAMRALRPAASAFILRRRRFFSRGQQVPRKTGCRQGRCLNVSAWVAVVDGAGLHVDTIAGCHHHGCRRSAVGSWSCMTPRRKI